MKRLTLLLLLCLLLTGCTFWMEGEYVSVEPHQSQGGQEEQGNISAVNYEQLLKALTDLVENGKEQGIIYVQGYSPNQIKRHADIAIQKITTTNPIGAYAVERIHYEYGTNAGQSALAVTIAYRHDRNELLRIKQVRGREAVHEAVTAALGRYDTKLVLRVRDYQGMDLEQLVSDYGDLRPDVVMETPQTTVSVYPEAGNDRVVELKFSYQTSREDMRKMQSRVEQMFKSAEIYASGDWTGHEKFVRLYAWLVEPNEYTLQTSITPSYSLLQHSVGDSKAFAVVYAALCRQVGMECMIVSGTRDGESWFWNMVCDDGTYYHVDLLRCSDQGSFNQMTDGEMKGYVWDYTAYPAGGSLRTQQTTEE